jgi:GH18 family chitinase
MFYNFLKCRLYCLRYLIEKIYKYFLSIYFCFHITSNTTFMSFFSKKFTFSYLLLCHTLFTFAQNLPCKEVIGYYPNWQWYDRNKLVKPTSIDYSKYTIINYAFFKPELSGAISSTDAWADDNLLNGQPNWAQGGYYPNTSIVSLAHNAGVKVVPSIGGWTLSNNFPAIAADATKRSAFANACVQLITQYNFDGIDIDWEYPGYSPNSGTPADKQNFTLFLQAIRTALNAKTVQTGKTYLLTACFGASQSNMANIQWANVVPILDCINLMSYDFFGTWDATTNHNAPLYAPAQGDPTFNIHSAINSLLTTYNVPANKICAGLAFYGRSHITVNAPTLHGAGTGQADKVTFAVDDGTPAFYNVLLQQNLFNKYTDNLSATPYLLGKNGLKTFVSYDDTTSTTTKANYIKNNNLRGCIIWEITGDYIETSPGSGVIAGTPLATAIKNVFCGTTSTACNVPNNMVITPNVSSASVNWAGTGAVSYNVQYKAANATTWTTLTSSSNNIVLSNLTASTAYQVQVQSVCASNSSAYSPVSNFTTTATSTGTGGGGGTGTTTNPCTAPTTFNFTAANYIPMGEIKIGQGRLNPIWGVTVDAYIPANKKTWAISMAHAAHLFRNVVKTDKIPANFYFATAAKESFCGCDNSIQAAPSGTNFPFTFQSASLGDGCFQIENLSAYTEMVTQYPQRFPAGQHANLIGNANFETAALGKAYYDIFTVKYWEAHKNWNPIGFFNNANDPNAAIKLMAVAYNRGLWYPELATVLNTNRAAAMSATTISPYFIGNNYGYDYQNALSNYTNILGNNMANVDPALLAINPATGQPSNSFNSFYNPQVTWAEIDAYIEKIKVLYPTVNIPALKTSVQTVFNSINGGNSISFRYNLGQVLDALLLGLPADDPSANIATSYGCGWQSGGNQTNIPPVVSILQPTQNQNFTTPANVAIVASASDPDGTISKVEFYNGTTLWATMTASPYSFTWQNVPVGTHTLTAKATDNQNAVTTSSPITITVAAPANQIPIVSITQPTNNQQFITPANVTINATASDPDGTISKVEFYNGTTLLGTDLTAPYSFVWQNPSAGTYQIKAKAYDNLNASATAIANITVITAPPTPTCVITSPANNAVFYQPANITINATANVTGVLLKSVKFYQNGVLLGTDLTAPYSFVWQNAPIGTYSLTAVATTTQNISTTSSIVSITVLAQGGNVPPTCSITQPTQNQIFTTPANVTINANATDPNGTVTKVDFYNGTTLLGTDLTAPYSFVWQNPIAGTYVITAKATDNQGAMTTSTAVTIVVNNPVVVNQPPTCSITQPTQNQVFTTPTNITINANAADADGTVTKVDFYNGTTLLGTDLTAPYSFVWQNPSAGTYSITAKATDNQGAATTSTAVTIVVNNPVVVNQPPTCSITQPTQNQTFTTPANITINANAADADGTVTKLDFYNGTTLLGTDLTAPYSFVWQNSSAGTYSITAKATDNQGAATTSTAVQITVNQGGTGTSCSQYPQYVEWTTYQNGSIVANNGGVFSCLVAGWCSSAASAYSPGLGSAWQSAWTQTGTCTQAAPNCATTPAFVAYSSYQTGSIVKNNNTLYQCLIPGWCSSVPSFYEPGVGSAWQQAWNSLGTCPTFIPKIMTSSNGKNTAYLFPNPTLEEVNIVVPDAPTGQIQLTIFDMNGRIVFSKNIDNQENTFYEKINLFDFASGIYNVKIVTKDWNETWMLSKI